MGRDAGTDPIPDALAEMEARAEAIARGEAAERVWLLEHPALYTAGTSAKESDLIDARFPVHRAGRGGQFTYHGPGQRVAYVMLDLKRRRPDVRAYVATLESWLIETLKAFDVIGETREDRVGVWVARPDKPPSSRGEMAEDKIAAIGVRVRRWATLHGVALNVDPDLVAFLRHRALRDSRAALRRHQPRRPRPRGDDGARRTRLCARRSRRCSARPSIRSRPRAFEPALAADFQFGRPGGGLPARSAETIGVTWIFASGSRTRAAVFSGRRITRAGAF